MTQNLAGVVRYGGPICRVRRKPAAYIIAISADDLVMNAKKFDVHAPIAVVAQIRQRARVLKRGIGACGDELLNYGTHRGDLLEIVIYRDPLSARSQTADNGLSGYRDGRVGGVDDGVPVPAAESVVSFHYPAAMPESGGEGVKRRGECVKGGLGTIGTMRVGDASSPKHFAAPGLGTPGE